MTHLNKVIFCYKDQNNTSLIWYDLSSLSAKMSEIKKTEAGDAPLTTKEVKPTIAHDEEAEIEVRFETLKPC